MGKLLTLSLLTTLTAAVLFQPILMGPPRQPKSRRDTDLGMSATRVGSRRNWKNSTPSRSRRFIIVGLVTISATIDAILPERK